VGKGMSGWVGGWIYCIADLTDPAHSIQICTPTPTYPPLFLTLILVSIPNNHPSTHPPRGAIVDRRRLLNPRIHLRRARTGGGSLPPTPLNAALSWLGRYALPILFLLALVLVGTLMVRVVLLLSERPHQGLVKGPAGMLLRRR
jgi:hypothetical protein